MNCRGGGAFWNVEGSSSSTQPFAYRNKKIRIMKKIQKCLLRCSLAQAIFTMSSVSVIDLWQGISWQLSRRSCFLGSSRVVSGQKILPSEVADVTGIVKYISKSVWRHQNVGQLCPQPHFFWGVGLQPALSPQHPTPNTPPPPNVPPMWSRALFMPSLYARL